MKTLNLLLFIIILIGNIKAQGPQNPPYGDLNKLEKPVTPQSPEVTSLGRYAMQPPSYTNGTPQQSISLYEINENGITYPLQLSYTTAGFRIKEDAGMAGLGWSLSEGMIARIVYDLPDDNPTIYKKFSDLDYTHLTAEGGTGVLNETLRDIQLNYDYTANRLYNKLYDGKPDMYIYNFNGNTGRFVWIGNQAFCFPHNDLKIQKIGTHFIINTPDGVEYTFAASDQVDMSIPDAESQTGALTNQVKAFGFNSSFVTFIYQPYYTNWRLTKILNKTTKAKVDFEYGYYGKIASTDATDISSYTFWTMPGRDDQKYYFHSYYNSSLSQTYSSTYYLKKIITDHTVIEIKTKSRLDLLNASNAPAIDQINVFSTYDLENPLKTITLTHGYFGLNGNASTLWLKLKKITLEGLGDHNKEYSFEYLDESDYDCGGNKKGCNIDHWGFANGAQNVSLVPKTQVVKVLEASGKFANNVLDDVPWANRDPNFNYSRKYALSKIYYPTKGYTAYNYESAGGRGIRIESQEDFDGEKLQHRFYKYYPDNPIEIPAYDIQAYTEKAYPSLCSIVVYPMGYMTITGTTRNYLIYEDDNSNYYEKVTEYIGTRDGKGGKSEYNFIRNIPSYKTFLTEEANYKYNVTDPIKRTVNNYTTSTLKGIQYWGDPIMLEKGVEQICNADGSMGRSLVYPPADVLSSYGYYLSNMMVSIGGQLNVDWVKPDQTTVFESRDGNTISQISKTYFNSIDPTTGFPKNTFPIKTENYLSNSTINSTEYYYAGDSDPDNQGSILGIPQMWDVNNLQYKYFISPVIKTKSYSGANLIGKDIREFTYNSNDDLTLLTGYEKYPSGSGDMIRYDITYDSYANFLSQKEVNNFPTSYIYGYQQKYPIVKAENASSLALNNALTTATTNLETLIASVGDMTSAPQNAAWKSFSSSLRTSLPGALITTYTYKPLVGMTSSTDPSGVTTYYEYDTFGRLHVISDDNKNILKSFDYNYKASPYPNPPVYFNTAQSQVFTKNGCPDGKIGAQVTYTVDARTYTSTLDQADANWLAQQEISKHGQEYADKFGDCIYPPGMMGITVRSGNANTGKITRVKVFSMSNVLLYDFDTTIPDYYAAVPPGTYNFAVTVEDAGLDSFNSIILNNGSSSMCRNNTQGSDTADFFFWPVTISSNGIDIVLNADYCP